MTGTPRRMSQRSGATSRSWPASPASPQTAPSAPWPAHGHHRKKPQTLTFGKVIDGATIVASGKTVALWGVKALDPTDPVSFAANLYLQTMLKKGALRCAEKSVEGDQHIMHCTIDGADVGSLMIQMGMARAADPYYQGEEAYTQAQHCGGVWHVKPGRPL